MHFHSGCSFSFKWSLTCCSSGRNYNFSGYTASGIAPHGSSARYWQTFSMRVPAELRTHFAPCVLASVATTPLGQPLQLRLSQRRSLTRDDKLPRVNMEVPELPKLGPFVEVTLLRPPVDEPPAVRQMLRQLTFTAKRTTVVHLDNAAVRGMINRVAHLVAVNTVDVPDFSTPLLCTLRCVRAPECHCQCSRASVSVLHFRSDCVAPVQTRSEPTPWRRQSQPVRPLALWSYDNLLPFR